MAIFKLQDGTKFYQWDVKRKLIVTDDRIDQVHFTNSTLEQAIVVPVYEVEGIRMADVPSTLLKVGCNITAYAFIYQEDKEYTLLHEVIGVTPRKQPDDYIPEDEEMRWATLQEEVLAAAEAAKTSEQNAQTAAENAGTSEQNALTAAGDAAESKEAAENAAIVAGDSATAAEGSATEAANSAAAVKENEQNAIAAAEMASTKADEASASAAAAKASENNAKESETNAGASETAAKESETNSKASETNAAASETNAQASAAAADASAKAAADSAAAIMEYDILAGNYAAAADASAKAAAASAAEAKASETGASESAATATTKAAEAAGSATVAQEAKTAAEAAAEAAEQAKNEVVEFAGGDFTTNTVFNAHKEDTTVHITADERTAWNGKAEKKDIPEKLPASDVPEWAKQPEKPEYTAEEVGALPSTYIPPDQTAEQVGADPAGTAAGAVSDHNVATDAHNDIRLLVEGLTARLNALANSDDETLDQMAELVAYIKDNRELIEQVTTDKVNVSDIIDNLTTNVANKPLSAAQGVALKALIDALQTSLTSHSGNSTVHITEAERNAWNSKSNFSGNYNDLKNKPAEATTSAAGFMSAADKANLDRLVSSAVSVLSGAAEPAASVGNDGDIYLVTGE